MILEIIATTVLVVLLIESLFLVSSILNIEKLLKDIEYDLNDLVDDFFDYKD